MFPWGDYRALRILLLVKQNIWKHYVGGFSFLGYPQSFSDLLVLSLGTGQHPKGHSAREATRWSLIGCPKAPRVDSVLNATADMVDLNISLLFQSEKAGANYLRIQVTHLLHSVLWNTFLLPKRFCILKPWIVYLLSCVELLNFADWQADRKFCINRHLWTWALVAGDWSRDATPGWASHATRLQDWEACTCRQWCNQPRSALQVAPEHFFCWVLWRPTCLFLSIKHVLKNLVNHYHHEEEVGPFRGKYICVLLNRANLASAQPSQHKAFLGTSSTRCMMLV
jgi:hypothetical protein